MKSVVLAVIGFLALVGSVSGQAPATSRSVFLDALETPGDSKTTNNWRTYDGSYSKTRVQTRDLGITVRNMATLPGKFTVEWYFFGKPTGGSGRFLYDKGKQELTLAPSAFQKIDVESKELSSNSVRDYYWWGYNYKSGDKADGWIVRVKVGDEVIRVKSSNAQLEQLEKNKAEFARLVEREKK